MTDLSSLPAVDVAMLAVFTLSIVFGLVRGLVFEVMSLLGWLAAYIAANLYAPWLAAQLSATDSAAGHAAAFALTFIGALLLWGLLTRLLRLVVHATPLRVIDRLLGGAFGALRAGVLLLAISTVVVMTPAARSPAWQRSQGAVWLQVVLEGLRPLLPEPIGRYLPS